MFVSTATALFETNSILFCSIFLCHAKALIIIKRGLRQGWGHGRRQQGALALLDFHT